MRFVTIERTQAIQKQGASVSYQAVVEPWLREYGEGSSISIKEKIMNRKIWFYGVSMVLLMLTATYFAITTDGNSWEDLKGSDNLCRTYEAQVPIDAPIPGNCWKVLFCPNPKTYGTGGRCGYVPWGITTGFRGWHISEGDHITWSERTCNWSWFTCKDEGVDDEIGELTKCYVTPC